eukprot:6186900-Pleurochrysis_carterae.AAC.1
MRSGLRRRRWTQQQWRRRCVQRSTPSLCARRRVRAPSRTRTRMPSRAPTYTHARTHARTHAYAQAQAHAHAYARAHARTRSRPFTRARTRGRAHGRGRGRTLALTHARARAKHIYADTHSAARWCTRARTHSCKGTRTHARTLAPTQSHTHARTHAFVHTHTHALAHLYAPTRLDSPTWSGDICEVSPFSSDAWPAACKCPSPIIRLHSCASGCSPFAQQATAGTGFTADHPSQKAHSPNCQLYFLV